MGGLEHHGELANPSTPDDTRWASLGARGGD